MASEGGGFKPGDFYVGAVELFAILLPGMILTYLVWRLCLQPIIEKSCAPLHNLAPPQGTAAGYLTFLVLSYVVGHFLAALGWVFMETVFEAQRSRRPGLPDLEGRTRTVAKQPLNVTEKDDLFPRALAYIDIHNAAAAGKLEAIEADCKFFRNIIPALLLSLPIIHVACFPATVADTVWILCFFGYVAIASNSFWRFRYSDSWTPADREPRICRGITSLWLLPVLLIPVFANIVLSWLLCKDEVGRYFLIDLGILLSAGLAILRYMLLQSKRIATAYNYLLAVLGPVPKSE
jgi:hypothetical protein